MSSVFSLTMSKRRRSLTGLSLSVQIPFVLLSLYFLATVSSIRDHHAPTRRDAAALIMFKSLADPWDKLDYHKNASLKFCQWMGVTCFGNRVVRLVVEDSVLGGKLASDSLSRLDQLRVLSLQNTSLSGPIPDFSGLVNLKSLFLDHNSFSGSFPVSVLALHRLRTLDLSFNNLTGPVPSGLVVLDRLAYLRLDSNRFNGSIPALNQSSLRTFNISVNNLTGAVPVTQTLLRFGFSSFEENPNLCGEIVLRECHPRPRFFGPAENSSAEAPPPKVVLGQSAQVRGVELTRPSQGNQSKTKLILGFLFGAFVLTGSIACFVTAVKRHRGNRSSKKLRKESTEEVSYDAETAAGIAMEQESELEEKVKRAQREVEAVKKSGSLVFCAGEAHLYTLDQLMRASAELLGRGTVGTTYKAVLDNRLIVSVKRLDALRLAGAGKESFERHMESVGGLRHPNLVPLRAFFQAKEERLLVYDYQPNGSLYSLVHGTKSTRAKPLHWTSCLKIAEDVAQGLSYIHQAWRLVHGNLKSSNVLLGPDFEACLADYCLSVLATNPISPDELSPDMAAYTAPEARHSSDHSPTAKSDVYSFGVLVLELLTGKPPSEVPELEPDEMVKWVCAVRDDDVGGEGGRLAMLTEVAVACSLASPERRPTMWQVLKMLQEIKESVLAQDTDAMDLHS